MSKKVTKIDNRSSSDGVIVNSTKMNITVACDQQQAGKFSVDLTPGSRKRVASHIRAQPYPYGKQRYDQFNFEIGASEIWEVKESSGNLTMKKVKN